MQLPCGWFFPLNRVTYFKLAHWFPCRWCPTRCPAPAFAALPAQGLCQTSYASRGKTSAGAKALEPDSVLHSKAQQRPRRQTITRDNSDRARYSGRNFSIGGPALTIVITRGLNSSKTIKHSVSVLPGLKATIHFAFQPVSGILGLARPAGSFHSARCVPTKAIEARSKSLESFPCARQARRGFLVVDCNDLSIDLTRPQPPPQQGCPVVDPGRRRY
jgi:hypothetical protein